MRYLILSDIHANWEALEAVLEDAAGQHDKVVCCGDTVGYGADPNAAADWVRQNVPATIRGNHDKAATGSGDIEWFNPAAREATLWTQRSLSKQNRMWLERLPQGPIEMNGFQVVHGSPVDEDEYIVSPGQAAQLFGYIAAANTFFGHTHLQGGFLVHRNGVRLIEPVDPARREREVYLSDDYANLVNPGSVGQPRDGDPRAAYAVYDSEEKTVFLRRVRYDVEKTQKKIIEAGLPELLAYRLGLGS